ncbi:hypothetical protein B0A48_05336 [Cryoendolithus antarcticus]|uniref:Heterokaryon incompatibility domain-containing protein n=1 Tax=Cryoendolithus antarcticus TaxID=1507870 RepID=A0A1V8TIK4_9PEZI|nr:hypothetical protein B0A48_05336 [Cryoendolithus antarcticus]
MDDLAPYVYHALPNNDSIRVLRMLPSDDEAETRCSLTTIPLREGIKYLTLSYTWGMDDDDATLCRSIVVDGQSLRVTQNLYDWLRRCARHGDVWLPIWIDAICINQADVVEKEATVARMADIYDGAWGLWVWLGRGNDPADDERLRTMLACFGRGSHSHYDQHVVSTNEGRVAKLCLARAALDATKALRSYQKRKKKEPLVRSAALPDCVRTLFDVDAVAIAVQEVSRLMRLLLGRRYWSRRWIIQEQAFSRDGAVWLIWGSSSSTHRGDLLHAIEAMAGRGWQDLNYAFDARIHCEATDLIELEQKLSSVGDVLRSNIWREPTKAGSPLSDGALFPLLLHLARDSPCSDPRDIIYALLSFARHTRLQADYSLTTVQVYVAYYAEMLNDGLSLAEVLNSAATRWEIDELTTALPSWCPDPRQFPTRPPVQELLGPSDVRPGNLLECTLVLHGVLGDDGAVVEATASSREIADHPSAPQTLRLENVIGHNYTSGDLVCGLSRNETDDMKLILRVTDIEPPDVRLLASALLLIPAWRQKSHPLIELRIH